jgi:RNA polymerase sigma-70 factor (ECF subfamily)
MLRSREAAEDVVQEVMLNLWRHRETLSVEDSLRAYLYRAVRNRALNSARNDRVRREAIPHLVPESPESPSSESALLEGELETAARAAIAELPPRCREIFELSRVKGLRYTEIAETLGISIKTVETQMGRALKSLRERLAPYLANDES